MAVSAVSRALATGVISVSQSLGIMIGPVFIGPGMVINPALFPSPNLCHQTLLSLISLSSTTFRGASNRKMSWALSLITKLFYDPNLSGENNNSFNTAGSLNHNTNVLNNNKNSFNTNNNNITVTDDRSEILTWLSPLEPRSRHHDIQARRVENVGDWLLRTEEFRSWQRDDGQGGSQKATIFCSGNPGVGKTYMR